MFLRLTQKADSIGHNSNVVFLCNMDMVMKITPVLGKDAEGSKLTYVGSSIEVVQESRQYIEAAMNRELNVAYEAPEPVPTK